MPNANASIYLVLNEVDAEGGTVPVTLYNNGVGTDPNTKYPGIMKYSQTNSAGTTVDLTVDVVEIHYGNSSTTGLNNVSLQVILGDSGNYFTEGNPVRDASGNIPIDVRQQVLSGELSPGTGHYNTVTLTYNKPASASVVMTELYFYTAQGMIDPEETVIRDPN